MKNQPIIHCITNYVAMDLTANALLAIGVRPLMSAALPEMEQIARLADALLINIGTLDDTLIQSAIVAGRTMHALGKPVVLDPVGVQATDYRIQAARQIIAECHPTVVKGNQAEMAALMPHYPNADFIAVTTGERDCIRYHNRTEYISGGSVLQTQVTAMGCTAGAIIAAKLTEKSDAVEACTDAMTLMKRAGEQAEKACKGTGTMQICFVDALYQMTHV
ncbi:MAG: hydroxyethylthiazole kinase [Paludibacteraceae bacterium]|nr:hydroxyethylthiazole kinase [Paludibacteraceae bacterium]